MAKEEKKGKKGTGQKDKKVLTVVCVVAVVILLVAFYIFKWQQTKEKEKLATSYLLETGTVNLEIKDLNEVSQILSEAPSDYFVLITYNNNEDTYTLEEGIKEIIDDYKLNDSFYYLNVTDIINTDNYLARINNAFDTDEIKKVPVILYYSNGKLVDTVSRIDDNIINAGDFQKLIDIYEIEG
jgi:hypothetical protein